MHTKWKQQLISLVCLFVIVGSVAVAPIAARAQGIPVIDVANIVQGTGFNVGEKILKILGDAALGAVRSGLNAVLGKIAYDSAVFIATGDVGQDSLFYKDDEKTFFSNTADLAGGAILEGFATGTGYFDAAGLCNPSGDFAINLVVGLEITPQLPYKPACTLSQLAGNWESAYSDPDFGKLVNLQFDPTANSLGISMEAENLKVVAEAESIEAAIAERTGKDFKNRVSTVSGYIETPGSQIKASMEESRIAQSKAFDMIGNPIADAINIFATTLVTKFMERIQQGLANARTGTELSSIISGEGSGASQGIAAAQERFADLLTPTFGQPGTFDILSELQACPEDPATRSVNNCSIGSVLSLAILEGWTVQELVDYFEENGYTYQFANSELTSDDISGDAGINYKGILVLKKYRIVPVGWDLAAQYILDDNTDVSPTLSDLVNAYEACGADDFSDYCHLIDPNWVLKAPQNFCQREAPGPDFADISEFDDDANEATQQTVIYNRLNYCADNRGCIQEEEEGVCTAYGYCTEEDRIYRFEGDSCDEEYSSCETYTDEDDNEVSYVKSSLNYDDCATDPGCQWYCLSTNDAGNYDCASPTETFITCDEDYVNSSSSAYTYEENIACSCTVEHTCIVRPGSDLGDDSGSYEYIQDGSDADTVADGVYDYWQCRVYPDSSNADSYQVCELDSACGADNPNYDPDTESCTCVLDYTCDAGDTDSTCSVSDTADNDGDTISISCTLDDEDVDGSADQCGDTYSTYSTAPVCQPASTTTMYCGDTCIVEDGASTCVNSLGNTCTDGDTTDSNATTGLCTLDDSCNVSTGSFTCSTDAGNTCAIGIAEEDPTVENDTLYFDNNAEECDSADAGCTQYIRIKQDTNLLANAFFTYYDEDQNELDGGSDATLTSTDRDFIGFCTHDGGGCYADESCYEDVNGDGTVDTSSTTEQVGECEGWLQDDAEVYVLSGDFNSSISPSYGSYYIRLAADGDTTQTGTVSATVDTGQSISERTFTFAYRALSLEDDGTSNCNFSFSVGDGNNTEIETTTTFTNNDDETVTAYSSTWQDLYATVTFPDEADTAYYGGTGDAGTEITVSIQNHDTCDINIDAVQLMEVDAFDEDYADYYTNNLLYLNDDTVSCEPEDVGCELYVETGKDDEEGIPGLITNPDSSACVNADGSYNYGNAACNQCDGDIDADEDVDKYAGCGFYQEESLDHTVPITEDYSWLSTEERDGVVERFGGYCQYDQSQYCFDANDCGDENLDGALDACQLQVSLVPASADQCSVAYVGCEEYTNLEAAAAGGESLNYYSEIKQCVKNNDDDTDVFYTFEGSEDGGIQIEDHTLKVVHGTATSNDGAPCTNLDLESEDYNADCADFVTVAPNDCGPDSYCSDSAYSDETSCSSGFGSWIEGDDAYGADSANYDADCRQYINDEGDIFYRYESEVVQASDDCTTLRSTLDTRVYFGIPGQSESCPAIMVGCREYKGTDSGSSEEIINDSLSSNSTVDWDGAGSTSNESPLQNGFSLELHSQEGGTPTASTDFSGYYEYTEITTDLSETDGEGNVEGKLTAGSSYLLTFWANVDDSASQALFWVDPLVDSTNTPYYFTTSGWTDSRTQAALDFDPNAEAGWQFYQLGPVILDDDVEVDDASIAFHMQFLDTSGTSAGYITTIQLTESTDQYLIKGTADTCLNFEGCREYTDRDDTVHYLKSFERLCGDDVVGCEAMLATQNSTHPYTEAYNLENEYDEDDVIVQHDQATTLVYDEANECSDTVYGCTAMGEPDVDERTGEIEDFSETYIRDLPDQYDAILCEQSQLSCKEYTSEFDGTVYFKNPGDKICTLEEYTNEEGETVLAWFKADSEATEPDCPKQFDYADPSQPLGGVCNSNSVNTNSGDNKIGKLCNSDSDCFPDGWSSADPTPRCISDDSEDIDLFDGGVHQYVIYGDDSATLETEDFGWVGQCESSQSGCSEYVDPYSPNIEEINRNWSFESDVLWENSVRYDSDEEPNGFPDYWQVPMNAGSATSYNADDGTYTTFNTQFDIDNDGTAEFDEACNSWLTGDTYYTSSGNEVVYSDQFGESTLYVHLDSTDSDAITPSDGDDSLIINNCGVENTKTYAYERDKLYTLRGMVKLAYSETTYDSSEFSIGLRYYDDEYEDVVVDNEYIYIAANHETIDWDTYQGEDASDGYSEWYQYQGNIGLGSTVEFPDPALYGNCDNATYTNQTDCEAATGSCDDTAYSNETDCEAASSTWNPVEWHAATYASVFVANHATATPMWFDAVSFKANDKYYYIDYTVDGTSEFQTQTGSGTCIDPATEESDITSDGGCVAFRDVIYDTQNYSQTNIDCTNCLLTPNSDSCRYVIDACDTNSVLKVKRDRVCSEWLACADAQIVTDEDGNESVQCFELDRCDELDEEGNCLFSNDLVKPERDKITSLTDLHYTTAPGDAESLLDARNLTGYSKAGMSWLSTQTCSGDSVYSGELCDADTDCWSDGATDDGSYCQAAVEVEGYIPYGWMYEVGSDGSETGDDLIEHNTFENLFCVGVDADPQQACIDNASLAGQTSATIEAGNCFRLEFEERLTNLDATGEELNTTDDPTPFVEGQDDPADAADGEDDANGNSDPTYYCPNSPEFLYWPFGGSEEGIGVEFTQHGWQPLNDTTDVEITQFSVNTRTRFATFGGSSSIGFTCAEESCPQIDVNNVLEFTGNSEDADNPAGAEYDLYDNIEANSEYSITFDGRFSGSYTAIGDGEDPTTLSICLNHNNLVLEGSCTASTCSNGAGSCSDSTDCEIPLQRKDCWVEGISAADIVFLVDTSSSMTTPIASVRQAIPSLAQNLVDREIDAKFAVVDMNKYSSVEFDTLELDLSSDVTEIANIFSTSSTTCSGADYYAGGSSARTDSPCLNASSASVDGFGTIIKVLEDNLDAYNANNVTSESISFRSNALPIFILVTDTGDEITDNVYGEADVLNLLYQTNAVIIPVTPETLYSSYGDAVSYWGGIADASGGGVVTAINDSDWTVEGSVVDEVVEIIENEVDQFQMTEFMETYSFGPLETTQLSTEDDNVGVASGQSVTSDLEISVSGSTPVQLDNVSLKPVLEVRKNDQVIGRTCRAYPRADAEQCEFTEPSGAVYKGWKGYCVEEDPSNRRRCITWWPLDYLTGEESIVSRGEAGYNGRSEVYHCLVAKGLENPGFCNEVDWNSSDTFTADSRGQGVICTTDSQCGSGECINDMQYDIPSGEANKNNENEQHTEDSTDRNNSDGYNIRMRWQTHDPYDSAGGNDPDGAAGYYGPGTSTDTRYGSSLVTRLPANEQLRNIHVSEIDAIIFNTGSAGDANDSDGQQEYKWWGQLGYDPSGESVATGDSVKAYLDADGADVSDISDCNTLPCQNYGNWVLTDFDAGSVFQSDDTGDYKPWNNCMSIRQNGSPDTMGFGCRLWGLYESDFLNSYYDDQLADGLVDNMDIVYVWAWSNYDWGYNTNDSDNLDYDCDTNEGDEDKALYRWEWLEEEYIEEFFDSPCVGKMVKKVMGFSADSGSANDDIPSYEDSRNPWDHIDNSTLLNCIEDDVLDENTDTCLLTSYVGNANNPNDEWTGWESNSDIAEDRADGVDSRGGSNMFTLWIDVNDEGYIQAVYYLIYTGAVGTDAETAVGVDYGFELTIGMHMHLDFQVRESCALIASSVDEDGANIAWASRSTNGGYSIENSYDVDTLTYEPYGSITPLDTSFLYADNLVTESEGIYNWANYNEQPVLVYEGGTGGRPLSCIGQCENTWCTSDFSTGGTYMQGFANPTTSDCSDDAKFMGVGVPDGEGNAEGLSSTSANLTDQIEDAANDGSDRLKHVFADIVGDFYRLDLDWSTSPATIYSAENPDTVNYWEDVLGNNMFDAMDPCSSDDGQRPVSPDGTSEYSAEYCGVLPTVSNITIDSQDSFTDNYYDIGSGKTVTLSFDATVDIEQEWLDTIYIDWGDGDVTSTPWEAQATTHVFTHAYRCGPEYKDYALEYNNNGSECVYQPKITITDNWQFCSGSEHDDLDDSGTINDADANSGQENRYDIQHEDVKSSCNSYDVPNFNVRVTVGN